MSTYPALAQALDNVVEVGSGSFAIIWQIGKLHLHLLREDVLLNIVVFGGHTAHGSLGPQLSRLLATHLPLHILTTTVTSSVIIETIAIVNSNYKLAHI